MANVFALHSVGHSIATVLRNAYPAQLEGRDLPQCAFELLSSGQLAGEIDEVTRVSLFLYRVTVSEHSRLARRAGAPQDGPAPLNLDLHFLLSAWAANALDEQVVMAWAMRELHQTPMLDLSSLSPDGGWSRDEVVQIVPQELPTEDLMRIWDALDPAYRLSASYVARVVRLDADVDDARYAPVVATRFAYGQPEPA